MRALVTGVAGFIGSTLAERLRQVAHLARMTDDLLEGKRRLEEAYLDLQDKHTELEDRRRYIETVLEAAAPST